MTAPQRIQLRRTRGWRLPPGAVSVARPSRFGNPFTVGVAIEFGFAADVESARAGCARSFESWLCMGRRSPWYFAAGVERRRRIVADLHLLTGRDLACYCPEGGPCHATTYLRLANPRGAHAGWSICPQCDRLFTVTPLADCMFPACGCWGDLATAAPLDRPCEPCGIAHAMSCQRMPAAEREGTP